MGEDWTFGIDERLFGLLRVQGVATRQRYGLFGHSAGGQFLHRMVSFGFRDRVAVAVSANAGTCAMPDLSTLWPFGLGQTDVDTDALRSLLGFRITVMAGTADVSSTGRFFPKGPRSMRQVRPAMSAHNYVRFGHAAAATLQTLCVIAPDSRIARGGPARLSHLDPSSARSRGICLFNGGLGCARRST